MEIGILGGTFNPVHLGHVKMCRLIKDKMELDMIIFVPAYLPPHKKKKDLADAKARLDMLYIALRDESDFLVEEFEIENKKVSYSIDTIRYLKKKYSEDRLFWIIGGDMLAYIEKWHDFQNVLKEIEFIAVARQGYDNRFIKKQIEMLKEKYDAGITQCEIEPIDISSTMVRERIKNGRDFEKLVHKRVEEYIINNNLYDNRGRNGNT